MLFVKLAFVAVSAWMLLEQPVIYPAISKTKQNKVLAVAEASLARSKTKEYRSGTENHHLVAKVAKNAEEARQKLEAVGIKVDDDINLVRIKTSLHRRLHTNLYYDIVNNVVILAYENAGNDKEAQRQAVLAALKSEHLLKILIPIQFFGRKRVIAYAGLRRRLSYFLMYEISRQFRGIESIDGRNGFLSRIWERGTYSSPWFLLSESS